MQSGSYIGTYRVEGMLGEGGMAEVYRVRNEGLGRDEALKLLPVQRHDDRQFVRLFVSEARTAARLRHPNIATIFGVSDGGPPYFFVMELVEGPTLAEWMAQRRPLSLESALPLLEQIASGLDYAHARGIIHRDVKPGNVLLTPDENGKWCVKVVDFGIARAGETGSGTRFTQTGSLAGTPEYMSPEQAGSGAAIDRRSDIYSLGVIAYEMLCGSPPFPAAPHTPPMAVLVRHVREAPLPPRGMCPHLPLASNAAILRALAKNPANRFATCSEFVRALRGDVYVEPPVKESGAPGFQNERSTTRMPVAAATLFLLGGLLLVGRGAYLRGQQGDSARVSSSAIHSSANAGGAIVDTPEDEGWETPTPSPTPEAAAPTGTVRIPQLAGTVWTGSWGRFQNSTLVINSYDGWNFSGVLNAGSEFEIGVSGTIDPATGQVEIVEGSVTPLNPKLKATDWGVSSNSGGAFRDGWSSLSGGGTVEAGNAFGWQFTRAGGY